MRITCRGRRSWHTSLRPQRAAGARRGCTNARGQDTGPWNAAARHACTALRHACTALHHACTAPRRQVALYLPRIELLVQEIALRQERLIALRQERLKSLRQERLISLRQ
jgi:hypothetical protein